MNTATSNQRGTNHSSRGKVSEYRCLEQLPPEFDAYRVCTLRERDIQSVRVWRNAQIDVLRQAAPISALEQERYYADVVRPGFRLSRPNLILLSLLRRGSCIGYTGLMNIDWPAGRAEISFLLDPDRVDDPSIYRRDFSACLKLLSYTAFEILGFQRLFAETFDVRPLHVDILEAEGYVLEGRLRNHARVEGHLVDSLLHGLLGQDWRAGPCSRDSTDRG